MNAARFWVVLAGAVLLGANLGGATARADGLPVLGVDVGATGVVTPSGQARYVSCRRSSTCADEGPAIVPVLHS